MREPKFDIIRTGNKVVKNYKDIKKYDVTRFEYGDYDNWVTAILLDVKLEENNYNNNTKTVVIHFCYENGIEETCYDITRTDDYTMDIIGYAVEKQKNKQDDLNL